MMFSCNQFKVIQLNEKETIQSYIPVDEYVMEEKVVEEITILNIDLD